MATSALRSRSGRLQASGDRRRGRWTRLAAAASVLAAVTLPSASGGISGAFVGSGPPRRRIATHLHASVEELEAQLAAVKKELADQKAGAAAGKDEAAPKDTALTEAQIQEVGNLAEDDEWLGFGMEMAIVMRSAIRESIKGSVKDFIGKEEYELGDLSIEADKRVKAAVAEMRGKPSYELGDLSIAIDQIAKDEVAKLAGKAPGEYEFGDLSIEIDKRVKAAAADFAGKETYEAGDLSRAISSKTADAVAEFTGRDAYAFGDISKEIDRRRGEWVKSYLQTEDYKFGDITTKFIRDFTGKQDYQFGDLTKAAVAGFTGKEEYEFGDITKTIGQALFGNKQTKKK
mmetsp:Transcript_42804/g.126802  ORF Transcript_42804/g.126802 Transcript_42804/m.126802 type:complete len:345 (-) Transcript_42804:130-1164(-)